jgi:hypothetical protein
MAISRGPKLVTNGLVLALDASDDNSFAAQNLPIKNGLLLWLDAADDDSFVYSSGTEVSQWRDKSGNNFHANQATVGNQPSRNTVVNSRKSVNFSSANGDRLRVNSGMVFTNSVTAIVFIKPGTQNYAYANVLDQDHGMDGANGWVIQRNNVSSAWLSWVANAAGDSWFNPNQISYTDNTSQIVTLRKGSSTITLYSNGTSSGDVAVADQQIRQANYFGLNLGSWRAGNEIHGSPRHYNGEICEVVVYNRALSLTELKQVHTYLGQKWGISNTDRSIIDLSGNNNNGLLGDGVTADMPLFDVYNKGALKLDGSNDYVAVANATSLSPTNVTASIWIKRNAYQSSITNFLRRNDFDSYALMATNNSDTVRFRIRNSVPAVVDAQTSMPLNTWTNLVGTFDGSNVRIYKDGVLANTAVNTSPINYAAATNTTMIIGRDDAVSGRYAPVNYGSILIYSRALSAAEVAQNYEAQKSKFANTIVQQGLVLNLDAGNPYSYAGAGTTWYDVSGNGKIGTLTGGVTYSSLYGGDFILDGVNGYIQTDLNQNTDNAQITWEAWFWDNSPGGFNSNTAIISNYGAVGTTPYTSLHILDTGNVFFGQRNSSGTADDAVYGSSICDSVWHHLVGVVDGSNMHIYVDGIVRASKTKITGTTTSGQNLVIGGNHLGRYQSCRIASARCYNIALSAAQVLQNYNATKGRFGL